MWPIGIVGHLKPEWDDPDTIAARLSRVLQGLAELGPTFNDWVRIGNRRHCSSVPALISMPPKRTELRTWIEESAVFGSREGRKKTVGYSVRAMTPDHNPLYADFWLNFVPEQSWFGHRVGITILSGVGSPPVEDNQALITLLRHALLTAASTWDCDWAGVLPGDYRWHERPPEKKLVKYQSGWMVYLDAERAAKIGPPHDVAVERMADGAMLLTAVPDTKFNRDNPNHMAAALRIQMALDLLNVGNELPMG